MSTQSCYHCQIFIHSRFLFHQMYLYKIPSIFLYLKSLTMTYRNFLSALTIVLFIRVMCVLVFTNHCPHSNTDQISPLCLNVQKCCSNIQFSDICRFFLLNIEKTISNVCSAVLFIVLMLKQVHISLHFKTNWPLERNFPLVAYNLR